MSAPLDVRTAARLLGGDVSGRDGVLCPGPGHSRGDRSLSVRLDRTAPSGFTVFSHSGDDFRICRDYIINNLKIDPNAWKRRSESNVRLVRTPEPQIDARITAARRIWDESCDAHGTLAELYLKNRCLSLPDGKAVLRFNSLTPWTEDDGTLIYAPCLIAAMRSITSNMLIGIQRTRISPLGAKLGRRMLGVAKCAAIKVDDDTEVTLGLAIGEGLETVLSGRQLGFKPVWAVGSAGGIANFPLLPGIETLTVFAENDETNARAIDVVGRRWIDAGAQVEIITPKHGNDLNDALRSAS